MHRVWLHIVIDSENLDWSILRIVWHEQHQIYDGEYSGEQESQAQTKAVDKSTYGTDFERINVQGSQNIKISDFLFAIQPTDRVIWQDIPRVYIELEN